MSVLRQFLPAFFLAAALLALWQGYCARADVSP